MTDQDLLNKIYNEYGPYGYIPLLSGAIVFTVIFGLLSIAHTFRAVHSKHYFMLVVAFGAFCECVGNGLRIYGHFHSQVTDPYIAQQVSSVLKALEDSLLEARTKLKLLLSCSPGSASRNPSILRSYSFHPAREGLDNVRI